MSNPIFERVGAEAIKHAPTILTVCGGVGLVTTAVMASKATLKAQDILEEAKGFKTMSKEKKKDTVKTLAKIYGPTIFVGAASLGCIFMSDKLHRGANAALATAFTVCQDRAKRYQEKVLETIGKSKEKRIQEDVHKEIMENAEPETIVISEGEGKTLCYDVFTGQYFKSDIETIRKAVNDVNDIMNKNELGFASLNEFYDAIGVNVGNLGEYLGWNRYYDDMLDLQYSSQLSPNKQPCLVISFNIDPKQNYDRMSL